MKILEPILYALMLGCLGWGFWNARHLSPVLDPKPSPALWENPSPELHLASWYAKGLRNPEAMIVASNIHPRGRVLLLRIRPSDPWVRVTVRDFGPNPAIHPQRTLDVSLGVARKLGMVRAGLAFIEVREIP